MNGNGLIVLMGVAIVALGISNQMYENFRLVTSIALMIIGVLCVIVGIMCNKLDWI